VSEKIVMVKAGKETIQTTPEHPFWVAGKGWVAAKELAKGDRLITPDEKVAVVGEVRVEAVRGPPVAVYNLEVENTHTYFVGRSGVWVHNACTDIAKQLQQQHGGEIWRLEPKPPAPWIDTPKGGYPPGEGPWAYHDVNVKDGIVYDPMQGFPEGKPEPDWLDYMNYNPKVLIWRKLEME
jgi:hypothetical protein